MSLPVSERQKVTGLAAGAVLAVVLVTAVARPPASGPPPPEPTLTVTIPASGELDVQPLDPAPAVRADATPAELAIDVRNLTATTLRVRPEVRFDPPEGSADWLVEVDPEPLVLRPGRAGSLPLVVRRTTASGALSHRVDVAATVHLHVEAVP